MGEKEKLEKNWSPPKVISPDKLEAFMSSVDQALIHDEMTMVMEELFDIEYPHLKDTKDSSDVEAFSKEKTEGDLELYGNWFYFPWSGRLVHFPPKEDLRALRTSRNRNLINSKEQSLLYKGTILVAGMSVGSNAIEALVSQGIGGRYILVDMDYLEPSNLNRIRTPYHHIGLHKIDSIAQKISEIDPYLEQIHYKKGLHEENLENVLNENPDICIDEIDNLKMKILLRYKAREKSLPVIMAADDGDNVLLDIERFDKEDNLPLLHGYIPKETENKILTNDNIPRSETGAIIGKYFVGLENTPLRMFQSLTEVGKTLPSWPQIGGAATLAGVTLAYCAKKILLKQPLNNGRFVIGPDEQLDPSINTAEYKNELASFIEHFNNA